MASAAVSGATLVSQAQQYLGVPYKWGGTTPAGFDCSGFTQYVAGLLGINIGRTTVDQASAGYPVPLGPASNPTANAQPGDLVLFNLGQPDLGSQHVGIYVGGGKMISAPNATSVVRFDDVAGWSASGEPISAIRRITTGGNSTAGATFTSSPTGANTKPANGETCLIKAPSQSFWLFSVGGGCLLGTSQARAVLGTGIVLGGAVLLLGGVAIIIGGGKSTSLAAGLAKIPGVGTVKGAGVTVSSKPKRPGSVSEREFNRTQEALGGTAEDRKRIASETKGQRDVLSGRRQGPDPDRVPRKPRVQLEGEDEPF